MDNDVWLKEAKIVPWGHGKYRLSGTYSRKVAVENDISYSDKALAYQTIEIEGVKVQITENTFRVVLSDYDFEMVVPGLGRLMDTVKGIPIKKSKIKVIWEGYKEAIGEKK